MGARTGVALSPAAAAAVAMTTVALLLDTTGQLGAAARLAPLPVAARLRPGLDCGCSCSARIVRLFTCGLDTPCCVNPCEAPNNQNGTALAGDQRTAPAVAAGRAATAACSEAVRSRDAQLERAHPVERGTPEYHHGISAEPVGVDGYLRSVADHCLAVSVASAVADAHNVTAKDVGINLLDLRINSTLPNPWSTPPCNASAVYRNLDGSCNNVQFPGWGQAGRPFVRLLCPRYADGLYAPVRGRGGGPLPSARLVRQVLLPNAPYHFRQGDAHLYTLLVMQWGQLVAHDTALTRDIMGASGFGAECCAINNSTPSHRSPLPANETASFCLPADGPGPYCLSVVRGNASFVTTDGYVGPGEQDDAVNSYIDASFVYGNSNETLASLRTNQSGLLITSGNNWAPRAANASVECDPRNQSDMCFVAGDARVNQNTQLTALQIVFLREHNRVARGLARVNRHWGDERLFQEARRIIIAVFQHITYTRLVPIYVGAVTANRFNLVPDDFCQYDQNGYQPSVDATTLNEFATASYRVFHGIAQSILKLFGMAGGCPVGKLLLNEWMDTPVAAVQPAGRLDQLLRGLSTQPMLKPARWIPEALGEHLFETDRDPGQDLGALDVQRGRDHGLPSYCEYRRKLGGRCCRTWRDLEDYIDAQIVSKMRKVYRDPQDVDLYVGLFLERPNGFALTGPTAVTLNVEQFWRWKYGDRFFYDFGGQAGSFTLAQLCEIKKVTAARLYCDNGDNITSTQRDIFIQPGFLNPVVDCQNIPALNLSAWAE